MNQHRMRQAPLCHCPPEVIDLLYRAGAVSDDMRCFVSFNNIGELLPLFYQAQRWIEALHLPVCSRRYCLVMSPASADIRDTIIREMGKIAAVEHTLMARTGGHINARVRHVRCNFSLPDGSVLFLMPTFIARNAEWAGHMLAWRHECSNLPYPVPTEFTPFPEPIPVARARMLGMAPPRALPLPVDPPAPEQPPPLPLFPALAIVLEEPQAPPLPALAVVEEPPPPPVEATPPRPAFAPEPREVRPPPSPSPTPSERTPTPPPVEQVTRSRRISRRPQRYRPY